MRASLGREGVKIVPAFSPILEEYASAQSCAKLSVMSLAKRLADGIEQGLRSLFGVVKPEAPPPLPKAERRDYTLEELKGFDGSDPERPILLAVQGRVFDVTRGRAFYGPEGMYGVFAGKDCTRALAKFSTNPDDCTGDMTDLTPAELEKLEDWLDTFSTKYDELGALIRA